ncbi:MAG: CDP-alcohol phosphatidyltransferase family protein [Gemmatimonadales bacterium]|nr:MAG: CDP-alcohol phosphatidyltransferase family protein [Gemmatimonadales bacterium]
MDVEPPPRVASAMLDDRLRPVKERVLARPARQLARWTSPTAISVVACLITLGAAGAAWQGAWIPALVLWLAGRTLDGMDGVVARVQGSSSDFGGYLDIVLDTVGYAAVPLGIAAWFGTPAAWMAAAVLVATFYVNTVSWSVLATLLVKREQTGALGPDGARFTSAPIPRGLVEGTETIVFYALMLALPAWAPALMWLMAALVVVTAAERVRWAGRTLRDGGR